MALGTPMGPWQPPPDSQQGLVRAQQPRGELAQHLQEGQVEGRQPRPRAWGLLEGKLDPLPGRDRGVRGEAEPRSGPSRLPPAPPRPLALVHAEQRRAVAELVEAEEEGETPRQVPDLQESLGRPDFGALLQQQLCHQLRGGRGSVQDPLETPQTHLDALHPPRVSLPPANSLPDCWTSPETPPQTPSASPGASQTSLERPKDPWRPSQIPKRPSEPPAQPQGPPRASRPNRCHTCCKLSSRVRAHSCRSICRVQFSVSLMMSP